MPCTSAAGIDQCDTAFPSLAQLLPDANIIADLSLWQNPNDGSIH
jgi:hypothetical protein